MIAEPWFSKKGFGIWWSMPASVGLTLVWLTAIASAGPVSVYFGTSGSATKGIYRSTFDGTTGKLEPATLVAEIGAPGFLAFHPNGSVLYAVGKVEGIDVVAAYQLDSKGDLTLLNTAAIGDGAGTHVSVHPSGRFLLTAQYGGGSVGLFPLDSSGRVSMPKLYRHHGGSLVVPSRQEKPHPHWSGFSPSGKFALIPDLGLDAIVVYRIDTENPNLVEHGRIPAPPGSGPRHMRFSADGRFIYLLNELSLTVSVFAWDPENGTGRPVSSVEALSQEAKAKEVTNSAAEILVHANGRFVYSSNRGHDSVTVYRAEPQTGELTVVETEPIRGAIPRNINLDPTGRWLLAAGADSNTVAVFGIDPASGELKFQPKGVIQVPGPICILFGRASGSD